MEDPLDLWERPVAEHTSMIAGWHQWADAGSVSSGLPEYLVKHLKARHIGRLRPEGFYLFQLPGMHDLLRPHIKLLEGYRAELRQPQDLIHYWSDEGRALLIFLGDEPHLNAEAYADAFFGVARALGVSRVATVGGVYAPVPFDKNRNISCTYSLPRLKKELLKYEVSFSGYEGGATIGTYLLDRAEGLGIEYLSLNAMVPLYDLSQLSSGLQGLGIENDYKAWYDVMGRLNHMFDLGLDLTDLRQRSDSTVEAMAARVRQLEHTHPQLHLREYLARLDAEFTEHTFAPLSDVWENELEDLFGDESAGTA
jgi:proteasome assembly chaperone (PAC2) family protein